MKELNIIFLLLFFKISFAQPQIDWQKCLGGSSNEEKPMMLYTEDGGSIVLSITESYNGNVIGYHGGTDIWL